MATNNRNIVFGMSHVILNFVYLLKVVIEIALTTLHKSTKVGERFEMLKRDSLKEVHLAVSRAIFILICQVNPEP